VKCCIWSIALCDAENLTLRKLDQKYLGRFEMCWRTMEKVGWTDSVRNEEVLHRLKMDGNVVCAMERRQANWIGQILRRDCLLEHITEGEIGGGIEETERQTRRRKQLLGDLKKNRGY
jgi:hypothetical protein